MKKIAAIIFMIITLLCSCDNKNYASSKLGFDGYIPDGEYPGLLSKEKPGSKQMKERTSEIINYGIVKGIWISYGDLNLKDMNEKTYKRYVDKMMNNISSFGLNTVFFHTRPFGDSMYESEYFPSSHLITGTQGEKADFDPLKIAADSAHKYKLSFHAWINPMRIMLDLGGSTLPEKLSRDNPAYKWLNDGIKENDNFVLQSGKSLYYNIGCDEVVDLIADGVEECAAEYGVDGIHFDDYFYPEDDENCDKDTFERYIVEGGVLDLKSFRRQRVNMLLRECRGRVKKTDTRLKFGVSPSGNIGYNYDSICADCESWIEDRIVDYIIPQIYYGFENETKPFGKTLQSWKDMTKSSDIPLIVGIAGYKTGETDEYALSGKEEWLCNSDILSRQADIILRDKSCSGLCIFDYDALFAETGSDIRKNERSGLKKKLSQICA
ncbi:MAG: family 10 glycosylhydrolase [Clostridia bacterium]|nr:family 10 glycosylhydrolase [Clostridia bacterium]